MTPKRKRRTWLDKLPWGLRERLHAEIDARAESLTVIYRRWNVQRFCMPRTFRLYGGARRRKIAEYERTTGRAARERYQRERQAVTSEQGGRE